MAMPIMRVHTKDKPTAEGIYKQMYKKGFGHVKIVRILEDDSFEVTGYPPINHDVPLNLWLPRQR